jgi:hypothetical protein
VNALQHECCALCLLLLRPAGRTGAQFTQFMTGEVNDRCMQEAKKILY